MNFRIEDYFFAPSQKERRVRMERLMSVEERIRRAEDIYNRRNGVYTKNQTINSKTKNTNKKRAVKRILMQIFVSLSIYVIFYAVTNREYIFSEEFRNSINTFFTEKINTREVYLKVKNFVLSFFEDEEDSDSEVSENIRDENIIEDEKNEDNNKEKNNENDTKKDENIGGATENAENTENDGNAQNADENKKKNVSKKKEKKLNEQELMEKDAIDIKKDINFIAPIKGKISSKFGWRNPTTSTVPKYHTGVDIAVNEGTKIKSATDGKVILASTTGDYGNHYQIQIKDVILVYAHCKKLYLKEGDTVKQGQEIAEVGSTGNSTGPHLHFEIRKDGRKIDPQLVLDL